METINEPTLIPPTDNGEAKAPYAPPSKPKHAQAGMEKLIFGGIALLVVILLGVFALSRKADMKKHPHEAAKKQPQVEQQASTPTGVTPADHNNIRDVAPSDDEASAISPTDVLSTKNNIVAQQRHADEEAKAKAAGNSTATQPTPTSNFVNAVTQTSKQINGQPTRPASAAPAIGTIKPFHPPAYPGSAGTTQPGTPGQAPFAGATGTQYQTGSSYSEAMRAWTDEVTKPRILYSRKAADRPVTEAAKNLGPAITNFGLEPGFHVAARMEASASTAVKAPVTAVIEYNYNRDGQLILPAGSRVIGHIETADMHGNMSIVFDTIDLPNGSTVQISAVGVDTNLRVLKGQVTGRNRGLEMAVATLSGIGQTTAMALGNNQNSALSNGTLMREQLSQNMGSTADTQVRGMIANEKIVVTLAAGTEFYLVFTRPALEHEPGQGATAANQGRIQQTSTTVR